MSHPAIIAHRGSHDAAPENTLAAFEAALALSADGIELDVHLTRDGHVVVHHDPVPRVNGPGSLTPFSAMDLADVQRLRLADDHPIPTLADALSLVGTRAAVYCELKGPNVVERAAPLLAAHRGPCAMHAFDHRTLRRAAELAPHVPRGVLLVGRLVDSAHALRAARADTFWPRGDYADAALVEEIHNAGAVVIVWTVNDHARARALATYGVDGICTDDVAGVRLAVRSTIGAPTA